MGWVMESYETDTDGVYSNQTALHGQAAIPLISTFSFVETGIERAILSYVRGVGAILRRAI